DARSWVGGKQLWRPPKLVWTLSAERGASVCLHGLCVVGAAGPPGRLLAGRPHPGDRREGPRLRNDDGSLPPLDHHNRVPARIAPLGQGSRRCARANRKVRRKEISQGSEGRAVGV